MKTTPPASQVSLFGGTTVLVDGSRVATPPGKPSTAFAVLALAPGEVVRTPALIDALWGDQPPQSARALVHTHVSALRRALTAGVASAPLPETVPGGYRLALAHEQVDVLRFLRLPVDDLDDQEIVAALRISAAPILGGCDTEFAESWRLRVSTQRTLLQHRAWARRVDNGESTAVLPDLRAAVQADPLWEGGVLLLARALNDTGRREEALATLDHYRRRLAEEVGLDPSPRMRQEHQRLLIGAEPTTAHKPKPAPFSPVDGDRTLGTDEPARPPRLSGKVAGLLTVAALVVAVTAGIWWSLASGPESPPPPEGPAVLFYDPQSGRLHEAIELPVAPDAIELDTRGLWVSSRTNRAVAYLDVDRRRPTRVTGLSQPPTSLATTSGAATVGLGFSGQLVTITDGRAGLPWTLPPGNDGRLTLAVREGKVWAATIDGELFGPDLTDATAAPLIVPGSPMRMAMDNDHAWVLTIDRREMVAVPLGGGAPVVSSLRGVPIDLVAAADGAWAVTSGDDRLWRASQAQARVVATRPLPGPPAAIAVGSGLVWVAVTQPAMLVGYDRVTLQQARSVTLPRTPVDIAAAGDLLLVAVR